MNRSTAILAVVALSLSAYAVARHVREPWDASEEPSPSPRPAWGWIGCRLGDIDDNAARELGLDAAEGVLIVEAMPGSPGLAGGLRDNDVVRQMDGHVIRTTEDLRGVVRTTRPGQAMTFKVIRAGQEKLIPVTLGQRPPPPKPQPVELPN